jgi:hypothetical protein
LHGHSPESVSVELALAACFTSFGGAALIRVLVVVKANVFLTPEYAAHLDREQE